MRKINKCIGFAVILSSICTLSSCGQPRIKSVSLSGMDDLFKVGDQFETGKISIVFENNKTVFVDIEPEMMKGFDTSTAGKKVAIINYENYALEYSYTVVDYYLESISVTNKSKTDYKLGDTYKDGDASLTLTYSDKTTSSMEVTSDMLVDFDTTSLGKKNVNVLYEKLSATYELDISSNEVTKVDFDQASQKIYFKNDEFNVIKGTITYVNNYTENFVIEDANLISGFDSTVVGNQELKFQYNGNEFTFPVTIKPNVTKIELKDENQIIFDKNSDLKDLIIIVTYEDETTEEIVISKNELGDFTTSKAGKTKVKIEYGHKKINVDLLVPLLNTVDANDANIKSFRMEDEDETYVDLSKCLSNEGTAKLEEQVNASGSSTANMGNINDNLYQMSFYSLVEGIADINMRVQSCSGKGAKDQELSQVLDLTVNGNPTAMQGVAQKASLVGGWKEMVNWNNTTIITQMEVKKGLNTFTLLSKNTTSDIRVPNIDYFEIVNLQIK